MSDTPRSEERDKAEWESRNCPICEGAGMVIVFHHRWAGGRFAMVEIERNGEIVETQIPAEIAAHCICKLGQWMRNKDNKPLGEALKARIPDGVAIAEGRSNWCFQPPGSDLEERYQAPTREAIARRFGRIPETTQ